MRQRNQFMIVFSLLLMLCGQTLASALMWCCLASGASAVTQANQSEPMAHMDVDMVQHHEHGHMMAASNVVASNALVQSPVQSHVAKLDMSSVFDSLLGCDHSCVSSCSNAAALAAVMLPLLPIEFAQVWPSAVPSLPQADPTLPFRPPIV